MEDIMTFLAWAAIALVLILAIGFTLGRLYRRAERDEAFVRTGLGGRRVIKDGGAIVLPVFQAIHRVKLNTVKLVVERRLKDAFVTKDSMRVDLTAEFYVRVKNDADGIALAAQTLGDRINEQAQLQSLVEAKLVDALRSIAAQMDLRQLHENRQEFVKHVQEAVRSDLEQNGLELESVSLTALDQTPREHFNPENTFDAVGLTALTKITEQNRKERNDATRETEVAIARRDLEATQETLGLKRQEEEARLEQERDIANKTASTRSEKALADERARQAEEEARIDREKAVAEREAQARRAREQARIESEQAIEISDQERAIAIAAKSEETSVAEARAREAQALTVAAEEKVQTAREREVADRARQIAVIRAQQEAESEAVSITVGAEAEKTAAADRAEAIRQQAEGERDAAQLRAEGFEAEGVARARAEEAMNQARNMLDAKIIEMEIAAIRIRALPEALAALMKPTEQIKEIRVFDTSGFSGGRIGAPGQGGGVGNLSDQLLAFVGNKPIVDEMLRSARFDGAGGSLADVVTASLAAAGARQDDSAPDGAAADVQDAVESTDPTTAPDTTSARRPNGH